MTLHTNLIDLMEGSLVIQAGTRDGTVALEVTDGVTAAVYLMPHEARHVALALVEAARLAEMAP